MTFKIKPPAFATLVLVALAALPAVGCASQATHGEGAAPANEPAQASPEPNAEKQAAAPLVSDRKLLCARIGMATRNLDASADLPLDDRSAEGGGAQVYVRDDYVRVEGELLGESVREHFDLRFRGRDLVCSRVITTSVWTIMERTEDNPEGRPPFWRADFRVYADGEVVHATTDEAPGPDEEARDVKETIELASELRRMYEHASK